jgi:phage gp29-like protein
VSVTLGAAMRLVTHASDGKRLAAPSGPSKAFSLEQVMYGTVPRAQNERTDYGKNLQLEAIARAIRGARRGAMVEITDMGRETLELDGHLTGIVQKRFNRVAAIGWQVNANDGNGRRDFDRGRATAYADFVRRQLQRIPMFSSRLADIEWGVWDNRAAHEIEWEVVPGKEVGEEKMSLAWRVRNLNWIHPRRISFTQDRQLAFIDHEQGNDFRPTGFLPASIPEKFIQYTPRLFGDYAEREGLLLRCLHWSFFQRLGTRERLSLMEIFGSPWRLAYSDMDKSAVNVDAVKEAWQLLQKMNSRVAAWLPHGVKAMIVTPPPGSGQIHKETIEDARFVLSKLVLGSVGSTDAVPTGLGSSIGDVHLSEEDLIIAGDLLRCGNVVEHHLTDRIIELNFGSEALAYAPTFSFNIQALLKRSEEIANIKAATEAGLVLSAEESYERAGYRMPRHDEPTIQMVESPSYGGIPAGPPRSRIVYPTGMAPPPGDLPIQPEEALIGDSAPTPSVTPNNQPGQQAPDQQAPAPTAKPEAQAEGTAATLDDDEDDDDTTPGGAVKMPFGSPSGLSDDERESDPVLASAKPKRKRKPKRKE